MISKERNSNHFKSSKIAKETYPNKRIYWQKVKNEVGFLQKENNLIDEKILKKLRYLHKLKAENLYMTSVIQHSLAVKSVLMSLNDMLRSPIAVDEARNSDDGSSEEAPNFSTCKINTLENDLLKEIMNQILLTSNKQGLISSQLKQNVLGSASFTSEASIDVLTRLQGGPLGHRALQMQVKD
nr:uncharacterized protein LOC106684868 [Halyomorpha halys]XP_024214928.1 uncharacterized protein LOC106684868 [Halyomorpha halys]